MVCYLGLGANLGSPAEQLAAAIAKLTSCAHIELLSASSVYRTTPLGYASQPDFLNMVIAINCRMSPEELLALTASIEGDLGRVRTITDGPRTIDIDILLCDDITMRTVDLILPHPRMHRRQFVLIPLHEIAPELVLSDGTPISELVEPDYPQVQKLGPLDSILKQLRQSSQGEQR